MVPSEALKDEDLPQVHKFNIISHSEDTFNLLDITRLFCKHMLQLRKERFSADSFTNLCYVNGHFVSLGFYSTSPWQSTQIGWFS